MGRVVAPPSDRFHRLFDVASIGMVVSTLDGHVLEINEAAVRIYGYAREDILSPAWQTRTIWADPERRDAFVAELRRHGFVREYPVQLRRKDGSLVETLASVDLVDEAGSQLLVSTFRDVTAQREAERLAERLADRLRRIFEASPVGMALVRPSGHYVQVNPALCDLTGYTPAELLDPGFTAYQVYRDPAVRDQLQARLRSGARIREHEVELVRRDGSPRTATVSMDLVDVGGETLVLAILEDATERIRLEREQRARRELESELERVRRDEAFRRTFLEMAAHELRTPLTPLRADARLLAAHAAALAPAQRAAVERIAQAVERLNAIVANILDAATVATRELALRVEPVDLAAALAAAVAAFAPTAARAGVALACDATPATVHADPQRLRSILEHLLGNAIKFTPRGGRVRLAHRPDGGHERVEVSDTGIGLTRDQMATLFQPYSQAHDRTQVTTPGVGLGLALVKSLVALHGGNVGVHSAGPGKGATFWFTLPREAPPNPSTPSAPPRP